jgi:hypothetical protein
LDERVESGFLIGKPVDRPTRMKPTPIVDLAQRAEQKRAKLARLRRDQYASREAYQRAVSRRQSEADKWERRLLAAVAASTLAPGESDDVRPNSGSGAGGRDRDREAGGVRDDAG